MFLLPLTILGHLRAPSGYEGVEGWRRLLPAFSIHTSGGTTKMVSLLPHRGSLLHCRSNKVSLLIPEKGYGNDNFSPRQSELLCKRLKEMGFSPNMASKVSTLRRSIFSRIERTIAALVDNLIAADHTVFLLGSDERKIIKTLIIRIFHVGYYSVTAVIDQYKEWSNARFHEFARTVLEDKREVSRRNIFRRLDNLPYIKKSLAEEPDYSASQHWAHLSSTRNFPYAGKRTEELAKKDFIRVTTKPGGCSLDQRAKMRLAAIAVGRKIAKVDSSFPNPGVNHISLTAAGEKNFTIAEGAQAKAILEAMEKYLNVVSEEDAIGESPFGDVRYKAGVPVWKTLFRSEDEESLQTGEWLQKRDVNCSADIPPGTMYWGLDEVTGKQILYIAYVELELWKALEIPIELRANPVFELGNKCRWITLCEWWLNTIQAPFVHMVKDILQRHPYAWSSFHKMDQAWEASKAFLTKMNGRGIPEAFWFLSSDLTNATNCQDRGLTKSILEGILEGFGMEIGEYDELVLDLLSERMLQFSDKEEYLTNNGIFMGEHLAKIGLVALGLCVEELSFRQSQGLVLTVAGRVVDLEPQEDHWWRFFHLGGDDHLAFGPHHYLDAITNNYRLCGSEISGHKHGRSRHVVRYCERVLLVSNRLNYNACMRFNPVAPHTSFVVDSIKMRLLARDDNPRSKAEDVNCAIGKGKSLGNCLKWLPKSPDLYPKGKVDLIRDLFILRMGNYFPNSTTNRKLHSIIMLPQALGGLDLAMSDEESVQALRDSPDVIKWIANCVYSGEELPRKVRAILKEYNGNSIQRGVTSYSTTSDDVISFVKRNRQILGEECFMSFTEMKALGSSLLEESWSVMGRRGTELNCQPSVKQLESAVKKMPHEFESLDSIGKYIGRSDMFTDMLTSRKLKMFGKRSFRSITTRLYDAALEHNLDEFGTTSLTPDQLKEVCLSLNSSEYVRLGMFTSEFKYTGADGELKSEFFPAPPGMDFLGVEGEEESSPMTKSLGAHFGQYGERCTIRTIFDYGRLSLQLGPDFIKGRRHVRRLNPAHDPFG